MFLFRYLQSCGLRGSFGLQTCKTPRSARGLQNNWSRKEDVASDAVNSRPYPGTSSPLSCACGQYGLLDVDLKLLQKAETNRNQN